jgi:hypothetical protein
VRPREQGHRPGAARPAAILAAFLLATCLPGLAGRADAQTTGTITGVVHDASGGVLPGVTLSARLAETGVERTATSGSDGRFTLAVLPVGGYELRAELAGFRTLVRSGVELAVGQTVVLVLTLQVGDVSESVTVVADASGVSAHSGELSYLVDEGTIEALPLNGRNYTDLAMLQPGVVAYPHRDVGSVVAHGVGMSVNGQDPRSNVYLLDGTLLNDFTNGPAGSAAGTALGLESVREFRVETNSYGAQYGRNSGGQVNVVTKSGTNQTSGSAYYFHRNDAFDARNYFDGATQPDFWRHQFGATAGGAVRRDRLFYFVGYEGLHERLGQTRTAIVPDMAARQGYLPNPAKPGELLFVGVNPAVQPYLNEYPLPNGATLGGGLADHVFPFDQRLDEHFVQARVDYTPGSAHQLFARYTFDDAAQRLPTDFPQFPRDFLSLNQYLTGEYRRVTSDRTLESVRLGFSRTRIGQAVEANTSVALAPFVPGRSMMGGIDVGGIPGRFGPQTSADVQLAQNVYSLQADVFHTRARHALSAGGLVEYYQQDMVNPTFSLGIYSFPSLSTFLQSRPTSFIGLTPDAQFDRQWRSWLTGIYVQDDWQVRSNLSINSGLRYEVASVPEEAGGRDVSMPDLTAPAVTLGPLYRNPTWLNLSPRVGVAWDVNGDGRTAVRGGYGLYFNTNNQQNLIVTVTNPPYTPRPVIPNPTFPTPDFGRAGTLSVRPIQWELENPRVHVWNVSVQREFGWNLVATVGYAGSRGLHLLRSADVNTATPIIQPDGTPFIPAGTPRVNRSFSTIELKSSDGDSWYRALVFDVRRRLSQGLFVQSSYTWSRNEDTTQASTFFSDATNGTTTAFPEFVSGYNKGLSDFHVAHNWVVSASWDLPFARETTGVTRALLDGWRLAGIVQMRSGNPLTVFVAGNRSRSQWNPSLAPGMGRDRPSYAPGRGPENAVIGSPTQWFDPTAFVLQPAGTFGNTGRGDFIGPDLRTVDLSLAKSSPVPAFGRLARVEIRFEMFNVLNRANFAPPALTVFSGQADGEAPLSSFGRIRSTVTSARQGQLGVRVTF